VESTTVLSRHVLAEMVVKKPNLVQYLRDIYVFLQYGTCKLGTWLARYVLPCKLGTGLQTPMGHIGMWTPGWWRADMLPWKVVRLGKHSLRSP
jgi:hypothetical protein